MDLSLSQVLRIEQKLQQSQEHRLTLVQKLALYTPPEFQRYISIEKDNDLDLFMQSLPFLVFHEFSHPLYVKGKIEIPGNPPPGNGLETGIDKAGMLLGSRIGRYTQEQMYQSHTAMMERAFRDHFELKKFPLELSFLARLYVEIQEHQEKTKNEVLKRKLGNLQQQAEAYIEEQSLREDKNVKCSFNALVREYASVYQNTQFR